MLNDLERWLHLNITQWDTETIGCNPSLSSIPASEQRSLESAFDEILQWMKLPENQNDFLSIFFDDQMGTIERGRSK
jgi:uncharacterized protein YqkB